MNERLIIGDDATAILRDIQSVKAGWGARIIAGDDCTVSTGDRSSVQAGKFCTVTGGRWCILIAGTHSLIAGGKDSVLCWIEFIEGRRQIRSVTVGKNKIEEDVQYTLINDKICKVQ